MDFKVHSLVARSVCPATTQNNNVWCLWQLCLCTIFDQCTSDTVRLRVYLTLNMFALRTFTVTMELLNINSVLGNRLVRLMGVVNGSDYN